MIATPTLRPHLLAMRRATRAPLLIHVRLPWTRVRTGGPARARASGEITYFGL